MACRDERLGIEPTQVQDALDDAGGDERAELRDEVERRLLGERAAGDPQVRPTGLAWREQGELGAPALDEGLNARLARIEVGDPPLAEACL